MRFKFIAKEKIEKLPKTTGIYALKKGRQILYIGKAVNIKERVKQHKKLLGLAGQLGYIKTGSKLIGPLTKLSLQPALQSSTIEALILEAKLIKKYQPKYNTAWKDGKNYFFVATTKEDFPRVFITHQTKLKINYLGPFVSGIALKQALKTLRKVFPYRSCRILPQKPCLWHQLNRCPAPCQTRQITGQNAKLEKNFVNKIKKDYQKNIKNLSRILQGEKSQVLKSLKKEMKKCSDFQDYEKALKIKNQVESLEKVLAHSKIYQKTKTAKNTASYQKAEKNLKELLKTKKNIARIEAYDVSNIQGQKATGSMITFVDGFPEKNFYRRFKIKLDQKPNDTAMVKEILSRRLKHQEWPYPDLILIDGGKGQLRAAELIINNYRLAIPLISLAKRKNELFLQNKKEPILLKNLSREMFNLILQLRDEAHRFAISYHRKLREKDLIK